MKKSIWGGGGGGVEGGGGYLPASLLYMFLK